MPSRIENILNNIRFNKSSEPKSEKTIIPDKGFTHGGTFHADDVFSTAFLQSLNPNIQIERGFKVPENYDGIAYDIGFGKFDHHQKDNESRADGTPYAAFGKLWREFAPQLGYSQFVIEKIDKDFIAPLDASDNGVEYSQLAATIFAFNPEWDSDKSPDEAFAEAVAFASPIFNREIEHALAVERARSIVLDSLDKMENGVVVLPQSCPWTEAVQENPDAKFVIFPSDRGGYNIQTVPTVEDPMKGRVPFPERWLGTPDESLGMTFCHPGNFLASTETLEQAINVANIAINDAAEKAKETSKEEYLTICDSEYCDNPKHETWIKMDWLRNDPLLDPEFPQHLYPITCIDLYFQPFNGAEFITYREEWDDYIGKIEPDGRYVGYPDFTDKDDEYLYDVEGPIRVYDIEWKNPMMLLDNPDFKSLTTAEQRWEFAQNFLESYRAGMETKEKLDAGKSVSLKELNALRKFERENGVQILDNSNKDINDRTLIKNNDDERA